MSECAEIATFLLPHYLGWLGCGLDRTNTLDNARRYTKRDPLLKHESMQVVDNIAWALHQQAA